MLQQLKDFARPFFKTKPLDEGTLFGPELRNGLILLFGGLGIFLAWATFTHISGAVIAQGTVVVENLPKRIQHQDGGMVKEILVKEGQNVEVGQTLITLDDTLVRSNFEVAKRRYYKLLVLNARLEAEKKNAETISYPLEMAVAKQDPEIKAAIETENAYFVSRKALLNSKQAQLNERQKQFLDEIEAYLAVQNSRKREVELLTREVEGTETLAKQGTITQVKLWGQQRDLSALTAQVNQLAAQIAQTKGKISEIALQLLQIDEDFRSNVLSEATQTEVKLKEAQEAKISTEHLFNRLNIVAPASGIIHELQVNSRGSVIRPGDYVITIIPREERLVIQARVKQTDIDQLSMEQNVVLRFPTFSRRSTPELHGKVVRIGADITQDARQRDTLSQDQSGRELYYPVRVVIEEDQLKLLGGQKLISGMVSECYFQTQDRTVMSYLMKPITDQFNRSMREK
jgi:HlyD family secretion protein